LQIVLKIPAHIFLVLFVYEQAAIREIDLSMQIRPCESQLDAVSGFASRDLSEA
jgi:hypothetical protein